MKKVLRLPVFWMIGLVAMLTFFAILGVSTHAYLRLTGAGYSPQFAGQALGLLFMTGLLGKLFSGFLADRFGERAVMTASLVLMIAGALGLGFFVPGNVRVWMLAFGLGWGALYTLIQVSVVSTFGTAGAGRILGTVAFLEALGGGLGPWVVGLTFDKTGSYQAGFLVVAGGLFTALILNFIRASLIQRAVKNEQMSPSY